MRALLVLPLLVALVAGQTQEFNHYWTAQQIEDFVERLASEHSSLATLVSVGTSSEGRNIVGLRVMLDGDDSRPTMIIDGGLRGREWVAPMAACYLLHHIVENSEEHEALLSTVNLIVIPLANPDGYEYSRGVNRLWQKSRSDNGEGCYGVDLNRNFEYQWNTVGGSSDPCADDYVGPYAFSTPETQGLRLVIERYGANLALYLSLQAAERMILYPFHYNYIDFPDNVDRHRALASSVAQTLTNQNGYIYTYGTAGLLQPPASGSVTDYVMGNELSQMALTLETRGGGSYGYDLPEEQLQEVLSETAYGLLTIGTYVGDHFRAPAK